MEGPKFLDFGLIMEQSGQPNPSHAFYHPISTMAIFDVVQLVRADVSTTALGIAASTASIILGGGTKRKQFAMPNTRIMTHQPMGGASGLAIDVEIPAKEFMPNKNNGSLHVTNGSC